MESAILMVDDKEDNLVSLDFILEDIPGKKIKARSGPEAIEIALNHDLALVLMDVAMPDMDGFEAARQIQLNRNIPIIFLTAYAHAEEFVLKGYASGAIDYLPKPFQPEILKSKVELFLTLDRQKKILAEKSRTLTESNWNLSRQLAENRKLQTLLNWQNTVIGTAREHSLFGTMTRLQAGPVDVLFLDETAMDILDLPSVGQDGNLKPPSGLLPLLEECEGFKTEKIAGQLEPDSGEAFTKWCARDLSELESLPAEDWTLGGGQALRVQRKRIPTTGDEETALWVNILFPKP